MTLDEWVDYIKNALGAPAFKGLAVAFLREHFARSVLYTDGTSDGGVDAWVVLESEPPVRVAAQFHAGRSVRWDQKLRDDIATFCQQRDQVPAEDPRRRDFDRLFFVCAQTPGAADVENVTQEILDGRGVRVRVFDARAIASLAVQQPGTTLWHELVRQLPGAATTASTPRHSLRDEALLAFAFLLENPAKYRQAMAKSAVATVLHRGGGKVAPDTLRSDASRLLRVSEPSNLVARAIRDLVSEGLVDQDGDAVTARAQLLETTRAALALADHESRTLRARCVELVEPFVPKGRHHRNDVAARAVAAVFDDLGVLVRQPIEEQVAFVLDPSKQPSGRYERAAFARWRTVANRFEQELGAGVDAREALRSVVTRIAEAPFARSLAAAELFIDLTEHDGHELGQALAASDQQVLLDTTIALPMMCSLFDRPVESWPTSVAAAELHRSLTARGIRTIVPSVYVEEIAAHLLRARDYADAMEAHSDLTRSKNFFVAHFCSMAEADGARRTGDEFVQYLRAFGAPDLSDMSSYDVLRTRAEARIRKILDRYAIEVESFEEFETSRPLPNEPDRDAILLRHDRAVVTALRTWSRLKPTRLVCTADSWLRSALNAEDVLALESHALVDLLELVRPTASSRGLASVLDLAASIGEQERELAATVWDGS